MRRMFLMMSAVTVVGCAGAGEEMPADTPATAIAPSLSLAEVAGTWNMQAMGETSDSVLTTFTLVATADGAGWTMTFPNRTDPVPLTVAVDGDSLIMDAGPYESVLRMDSALVTTHVVSRLEDGMLAGTFVAHYSITSADSVLRGRVTGSRVP